MKSITSIIWLIVATISFSQEQDIVKIIDDLTIKWDKQAVDLSSYSGIKYYCTSEVYRDKTISLLDKIHHYDTVLYQIVTEKYENKKDKEAEATLKEILTVETEYTTPNFKTFLEDECERFNEIREEYSQSSSKFAKEAEKLEKELNKYVSHITERIDLIDEHIHHLKLN